MRRRGAAVVSLLAARRAAVDTVGGGGVQHAFEPAAAAAPARRPAQERRARAGQPDGGPRMRRVQRTVRMRAPRVALFTDSYYEANGVARTAHSLEAFAASRERPLLVVHGG